LFVMIIFYFSLTQTCSQSYIWSDSATRVPQTIVISKGGEIL
jgi:hypothetical protein